MTELSQPEQQISMSPNLFGWLSVVAVAGFTMMAFWDRIGKRLGISPATSAARLVSFEGVAQAIVDGKRAGYFRNEKTGEIVCSSCKSHSLYSVMEENSKHKKYFCNTCKAKVSITPR